MPLIQIQQELRSLASPMQAKNLARFFKTGKGDYGEGDKFLGIKMPEIRNIVRKNFKTTPWRELEILIKSPHHEERMLCLLILVAQYKKAEPAEQEKIYTFYLTNTKFINNWDLVDLTAEHIVGAYLADKDQKNLLKLAKSKLLWNRRIAVMATFYFIKKDQPEITLKLAEVLLNDKHDLIHKAVGWMLREIGKRCSETIEEEFLKKNYQKMPRTMLRYATERFSEEKRQFYLKK
jgi:3-methyladenine DNA glycosylase AlkD